MNGDSSALVLSGGGARGAYQAGVLYGLVERGLLMGGPTPFKILVGTSAGSIHATALAAYADRFEEAVVEMVSVWNQIQANQVFRTDFLGVAQLAYRWARDLGFGGLVGGVRSKSLLDTSPLPQLLQRIPFRRIPGQLEKNNLRALAIPATEYFTKNSVIFMQGQPGLPAWEKSRNRVEPTTIDLEHVLASSAIPMFFPTVSIGGRHFGDGCIRNTRPLGPAIRLGAEKILAIGVHERSGVHQDRRPMIADVAGTLLDAVMMDAMETDVAHCRRISENVSKNGDSAFKKVDVLWLSPSMPIAPLAEDMMDKIPIQIRYFLRGLGGDKSVSELASFLLFHPDFCRQLIDLGRADVQRQEQEIEEFLTR